MFGNQAPPTQLFWFSIYLTVCESSTWLLNASSIAQKFSNPTMFWLAWPVLCHSKPGQPGKCCCDNNSQGTRCEMNTCYFGFPHIFLKLKLTKFSYWKILNRGYRFSCNLKFRLISKKFLYWEWQGQKQTNLNKINNNNIKNIKSSPVSPVLCIPCAK